MDLLDELYEDLQQLHLPKRNIDLTNLKDIQQLEKELYQLNRGNILLPVVIVKLNQLKRELRKL